MSEKKKDKGGPAATNPKKVKLLRPHDRYKVGDVVNHHGVVADAWVRRKIAVPAGDGDPKVAAGVVTEAGAEKK